MGLWHSLFNGEKPVPEADFSALGVDIHSHLIPGLDDGAADPAQALEMVRGFAAMGYSKLITTPHVYRDYYYNNAEGIRNGLKFLRESVQMENVPVELDAAAEYMLDDEFEHIAENEELLTINNKYILLELSTYMPYPGYESVLFNLRVAGYQVILAHVERYAYWFSDLRFYEDLKDREVLLQVNLLSFTGHYGTMIRRQAETLAEHGLIDFLGSDLHTPEMLPAIQRSAQEKHIRKLIDSGKLMNAAL